MIISSGSSNPRFIFIADSPSTEDLNTNYSLSGYAGTLLASYCKQNNLDYESSFRTTFIKEEFKITDYVHKQKGYNWELIRPIADKWIEQLVYEINQLEPFLLIPLGEISFHYLTKLYGLRKFRGSIMLARGDIGLTKITKVLPVLGPYILYKDVRMGFITKMVDFAKIPKYLNDNLPPDNLIKPWIAKTSTQFRNFIDRCYPDAPFVVFDIETFMGIPSCISFCFDGFESCCIPLIDHSIDSDNRVLMLDLVSKLLSSPIPKVNQNIKYDWKILDRWGFSVKNIVGDSMLAASVNYCEFPKNLGFLTSIYTDIPYFKDEGRAYDPRKHSKDQFYLYNAKDSLATHQVYKQQVVETKELGVDWVYGKLIEIMPLYMKMEDNGIRIDESAQSRLIDKYEILFQINKFKIQTLTGVKDFNPLSAKQSFNLVFNWLGFDPTVKGVHASTTEESLLILMADKRVAKHAPNDGKEILQLLVNCRKIHKVLEVLELPLYPDGRFRCEFNLAGTVNGRTSAGKTTDEIFYTDSKNRVYKTNLGHSLQTIGKHPFFIDGKPYGTDIRNMYVPSRGYRFVEIDLSQAEARVDAVLSNNFSILSVFDGPIGIHRLTGSWVFDCDPLSIKKGTIEYHMAKTVRHAAERNMGVDRLFAMTQQPIETCKKVLAKIHKAQPEIREVFHRGIIDAMRHPETGRTLKAPNGRRHDFFGRIDKDAFNEGISFIPQAIVSDQTKFLGILPTFSKLKWARLLTEQHDGTLAEIPIGREEEFAIEYKKNIEQPINFKNCTLSRDFELIIPCEVEVGCNWEQLRPLKI